MSLSYPVLFTNEVLPYDLLVRYKELKQKLLQFSSEYRGQQIK